MTSFLIEYMYFNGESQDYNDVSAESLVHAADLWFRLKTPPAKIYAINAHGHRTDVTHEVRQILKKYLMPYYLENLEPVTEASHRGAELEHYPD